MIRTYSNGFVALFLLITCLSACNQNASDTQKDKRADSPKQEEVFCVRGVPEPSIEKRRYPDATFELYDSTTALEKVKLNAHDSLYIHHGGCEYISYSYEYISPNLPQNTTDLKPWYTEAAKLLRRIHGGHKPCCFNYRQGIRSIQAYVDTAQAEVLQLKEELDFSDNEIRNFFYLEKVGREKEKGRLKFVISVGPL